MARRDLKGATACVQWAAAWSWGRTPPKVKDGDPFVYMKFLTLCTSWNCHFDMSVCSQLKWAETNFLFVTALSGEWKTTMLPVQYPVLTMDPCWRRVNSSAANSAAFSLNLPTVHFSIAPFSCCAKTDERHTWLFSLAFLETFLVFLEPTRLFFCSSSQWIASVTRACPATK